MDQEAQRWLSDRFTQDVVATRATRGFDKRLSRDMAKASDAFGPGGPTDVGHEKPFALTRAGEQSTVKPQPASANRSEGATVVKKQVEATRKAGGFTRKDDVDPSVPKGTRFDKPDKAGWREPMSQWKGSVPQPKAPQAQTPPTAPQTPAGSHQLELKFNHPNAPKPAPAATLAPTPKPTPPLSTAPAKPPVGRAHKPGTGGVEVKNPKSGMGVKGLNPVTPENLALMATSDTPEKTHGVLVQALEPILVPLPVVALQAVGIDLMSIPTPWSERAKFERAARRHGKTLD
jgi:hypothetical protein